jgi:hypothetical protein
MKLHLWPAGICLPPSASRLAPSRSQADTRALDGLFGESLMSDIPSRNFPASVSQPFLATLLCIFLSAAF